MPSHPSKDDRQPIPRPGACPPADGRFYDLAERYLDGTMRLNPFIATYLGYHAYDPLLDDMTPQGLAEKLDFYRDARKTFAAVAPAGLSVGAAIDLDLIRTDIESNLFNLTELKPHENDPQTYNDIIGYGTLYLTILEDGSPQWPDRLDALLSRMRALPGFLAAAKSNLTTPAPVITQFIIDQNPGNLAFFEQALPPLFARYPALKAKFDREQPKVLAALREYQSFLETDLKRRSTGDWRLGRELWTRKLQLALQSDLSPEEIEARAWSALTATRQEMLQLALPLHEKLHPGHCHGESGDDLINVVINEVVAEVSKRHSTPDRLLENCSGWVDKIKAFVRRVDLITLPPDSDNFVIERTPAFLDGMAVAFFNTAPAFEPHLKKSFWISSIPKTGDPAADAAKTASYLREYNDYGLQALSMHEAVPGHYVQFYYALNSPMASIYKKVFSSGSFAEGWAVLCEKQVFDAGYADAEPEALLIHKKISLRAPINAIIDARLHTGAIPEPEGDKWALDLMRRRGFQEETEAQGKLRRAKVSSTQLSTYFVGFLELSDLMAECRAREGSSFSLKRFNEKLLSFGTIPPRAVRRLMLG